MQKQENLFRLLGKFKPEQNQNWKSILTAIGEVDDDVMKDIEFVRDNLLWTTANGQYLDALASNNNVKRPKGAGMSDKRFRRYAPIMAYAPKQVRSTIEQLLEIFYTTNLTSAYVESQIFETCFLQTGWTLSYLVDDVHDELINFTEEFFSDITHATPEEIAVCITSKASNSYADVFYNKITKTKSVRVFSKSIGIDSSIRLETGLIIHALNFKGVIHTPESTWNIVRTGSDLEFRYSNPSINLLQVQPKDSFLIYSPTFSTIGKVREVYSDYFTVESNIQLSASTFSSDEDSFVSFFSPIDNRLLSFERKAVIWEVEQGKMAIDFPATPPVYRKLIGSGHMSSLVQKTVSYENNELTLNDASLFPESGVVRITPQIKVHQTNNQGIVYSSSYSIKNLSYSGKVGNTLLNISIPESTIITEPIVSIQRVSRKIVLEVEDNPFLPGDSVIVHGSFNMNGTYLIESVDGNLIYIVSGGLDIMGSGGFVSKEISSVDLTNSVCHLCSASPGSGLLGPHVFDKNVPFVITSKTFKNQTEVLPGTYASSISINSDIKLKDFWVIFDFGKASQEGPVKAFLTQGGVVQLDTSYLYQFEHKFDSSIVVVNIGNHIVSSDGKDIGLYATDPSVARKEIQKAIKNLSSAGITIEWLLQYRKLVYCNFDVDK